MERSQRLYKLWRVQTNKREGKSQKSVIFGCLFLYCGISTRCKITGQGASGNSRCQISFTCTGDRGHCRHSGLSRPHHRSGCSRTALLRALSALRRRSEYSPVAIGRCVTQPTSHAGLPLLQAGHRLLHPEPPVLPAPHHPSGSLRVPFPDPWPPEYLA